MSSAPEEKKKKIVLNVFVHGDPASGQWTNPNDVSRDYNTLEYWIKMAQIAERGKFLALFFADYLAFFDVYKGPDNWQLAASNGFQIPKIEPGVLVTAISSQTESIGLGISFSTVSEHPYLLSRRLGSLDHMSNGRIGWNIISSYAKNIGKQLLNGTGLPEHDQRYAKTEEYADVVKDLLLSSWRDDALKVDKANGIFVDPQGIRKVNHKGDFFEVEGPGITQPSPQRFPVVIQAGTSKRGKLLAAENAEIIYVNSWDAVKAKRDIAEIRRLAKDVFGRDPTSLKFVGGITPVVARTHEEAELRIEQLRKHASADTAAILFSAQSHIDLDKFKWDEPVVFGKVQGGQSVTENIAKRDEEFLTKGQIIENGLKVTSLYGSPSEIADFFENNVKETGLDGYNLVFPILFELLEDFVELVVPELQKRGIYWEDYPVPGGTFRENLYGKKGQTFVPENHPYYNLRWTEGVPRDDFDSKILKIKKDRSKLREDNRDNVKFSV